jgi:hypothetical protein
MPVTRNSTARGRILQPGSTNGVPTRWQRFPHAADTFLQTPLKTRFGRLSALATGFCHSKSRLLSF